jgi:hypothetical protein
MIALSEKQRDEADAVCSAILATCARINADLQAAANVIKAETVRCPRCGVHPIAGEPQHREPLPYGLPAKSEGWK